MKTKKTLFAAFFGIVILIASCETPFEDQSVLDSLKNGTLDLGSVEINDAMIRKLQYQKIKKSGKTNGVVINKEFLTTSVNGFTQSGVNYPEDSSNYTKWDFLVVYPGIEINQNGQEKLEPAFFFYKGSEIDGKFLPTGNPVLDVSFPGGGGGPTVPGAATPPPSN